jgi:hypothetical protein
MATCWSWPAVPDAGPAGSPGGAACFIDESDAARIFEPDIPDPAVPVAWRRLGDTRHRIVKIFYSPRELADRLAGAGWSARVHRVGGRFYAGSARPRYPG